MASAGPQPRPHALPKLLATSVVRGTQQGESHGGVYLIDFGRREVEQKVDWNTSAIDFTGRGRDRGLRGIAFYGDEVYIAASDEIFCYDRTFRVRRSFRNRYLKHCHEICVKDARLFLSSTGYDSVLMFDLHAQRFAWAVQVAPSAQGWNAQTFDPEGSRGPAPRNALHLNNVYADDSGLYLSGMRTGALLRLDGSQRLAGYCSLPQGVHNARPFRGGVLFNDTAADHLRFVRRTGEQCAFPTPRYDPATLESAGLDDSGVARQGFGRGLCPLSDRLVAAGSSPSTITLYDLDSRQRVASVNLTMDIRNAIHGLEIWPFE